VTATLRILGIEVRLLGADPYPIVLLVAMPLVLVAFLNDGMVGGAEQAVPGMLVLFAFLGLYNVGMVFFRDHGWRTWGRLRTSAVATWHVVAGKTLPLVVLYLVQSAVLLGAGVWLFGMDIAGTIPTLAVVVAAVVVCLTGIGLAVVSLCRTMNQVSAVTNLGGLVLSGLGGALAPVSALPAWAQHLAPLSPVYWALSALRGVIVDGSTLVDLGKPLAVLLGVSVAGFAVAVLRFRAADVKEYYA